MHINWHPYQRCTLRRSGQRRYTQVRRLSALIAKLILQGISTFGGNPDRVGPDHLQQLFDHALEYIPQQSIPSTPIFLLATAGMRLLPDLERKRLLDRICAYTKSATGFKISNCGLHIQVISGETEGLYGWIATNYLLGGFDSPAEHDHGDGHHTYGFLDMGGASAQIAFAPNTTEAQKHAEDLKLLRFRKVNGDVDEYKVFVTTWLEFGVHQARRRYVESLMNKYGSMHGELPDPCLPKGLTISTTGDILAPDKINGKEVHLVGTAKFQECLRATFPLLNKDKPCEDQPCLLNGVHVPAIDFTVNHFVGVSEYWHTTHEIFEFAHKDKAYDWKTYQERVDEFCSTDWSRIQEGVKAETWGDKVTESTTAEVCFKASWLINVLHDGIGVPRVGLEELNGSVNGTKQVLDSVKSKGFTDAFQAVNKIDDKEVSWTLGRAVLYAASEISPKKTNTLPVGFGSNTFGIPKDFQFAGEYHPPRPNATQPEVNSESDGWRDTLFHGKTPRRVPGLLLFMLIVCIAVFLLCGKDRRSRFFQKIIPRRFGRRFSRSGMFQNKPSFLSSASLQGSISEQRQRLLESGNLQDPNEFELGSLDGAMDDDLYSDDSGSTQKGKASALNTPRFRTPKLESSNMENFHSIHRSSDSGSHNMGSTSSGNAMDRGGLFIRTESRESLSGLVLNPQGRTRSRRGSPTRYKNSPLIGSTALD